MNLLLFNLRVDRGHSALGFTTDWINELARHFEKLTVITMYSGEVTVAPNVKVLSVGQENGYTKPRRALEFYRHLVGVLRQDRYAACFAHMNPLFAVMGAPMLKARRIPIVLWYAHNHRPPILTIANHLIDRALSSAPNAYPIKTNKLRIIGQGIDTSRFSPSTISNPNTPLVFYTIGRVSPVKRLETLLDAFTIFLKTRPSTTAHLNIIGQCLTYDDETYKASLKVAIKSAGLESVVHFFPAVPFHQVHETHRAGDIFLHANGNGLDKALLEAMSCGLPTISSHPEMAECLGEWSATTPDQFAERMITLSNMSRSDRAEVGLQLRNEIVTHHSLSSLGHRLVAQIDELT